VAEKMIDSVVVMCDSLCMAGGGSMMVEEAGAFVEGD
jgi:hypothetical protein